MRQPRDPLGRWGHSPSPPGEDLAGETSIDPDLTDAFQAGVRPATRQELENLEHEANVAGIRSFLRENSTIDHMCSVQGIVSLNRHMFGNVWAWAGRYRRHETNIGIDPAHIPVRTAQVLDTLRYQLTETDIEPRQTLARVHWELVFIHPFPNGNGRTMRTHSALLARKLGLPTPDFSNRQAYLRALDEADRSGEASALSQVMWGEGETAHL